MLTQVLDPEAGFARDHPGAAQTARLQKAGDPGVAVQRESRGVPGEDALHGDEGRIIQTARNRRAAKFSSPGVNDIRANSSQFTRDDQSIKPIKSCRTEGWRSSNAMETGVVAFKAMCLPKSAAWND